MNHPIDVSTSLAYAKFAGRTEAILAADRSDAWKVEQTRDALARMDAEIAAIRRLADKPADPMTPRSIYDRWADASSPEAVNVTSMPTGHGTARHDATPTPTWDETNDSNDSKGDVA